MHPDRLHLREGNRYRQIAPWCRALGRGRSGDEGPAGHRSRVRNLPGGRTGGRRVVGRRPTSRPCAIVEGGAISAEEATEAGRHASRRRGEDRQSPGSLKGGACPFGPAAGPRHGAKGRRGNRAHRRLVFGERLRPDHGLGRVLGVVRFLVRLLFLSRLGRGDGSLGSTRADRSESSREARANRR